jgi:hypothetical protein
MTKPDPATREGALILAAVIREQTARLFLEAGALPSPMGAVVVTHHLEWVDGKPITGARLPQGELVDVAIPEPWETLVAKLGGEEARKDCFAHLMREHAKIGKATTSIVISEMWYVSRRIEEMKDYKGAAGDQADRKEALFVQLEHVDIPQALAWRAEILRDPLRVQPWQQLPHGVFSGRLSGILKEMR